MRLYFIALLLLFTSCRSIDEIGVLVPPTVDQDASLPSVKINVAGHDRLIHVHTFGDKNKPVLFFLHGSYTDTRAYRNICEALADKYFVVIWDQRGCGLSERITEEEFTLETAVDEIVKMKQIYSPGKKITVIGQSWGGGLATLFTSKHPDLVAQLLLMEPIPLTGDDMMHLYKNIIQFTYDNGSWNNLARHGEAITPAGHEQIDYRAMMILRSTMTSNYHCDGRPQPEWPIHRVGGYLESIRNKRLGDPVNGFTFDFRDGIQNFADSVLILGGSCSSLGYDEQLQYTKPHFKQTRVQEIKDAGHRMNIDQFEQVIFHIKAFLREY